MALPPSMDLNFVVARTLVSSVGAAILPQLPLLTWENSDIQEHPDHKCA
jgi:hypothetical protein